MKYILTLAIAIALASSANAAEPKKDAAKPFKSGIEKPLVIKKADDKKDDKAKK
jgi:hypothetical protein